VAGQQGDHGGDSQQGEDGVKTGVFVHVYMQSCDFGLLKHAIITFSITQQKQGE
jgi:hypothetical protein